MKWLFAVCLGLSFTRASGQEGALPLYDRIHNQPLRCTAAGKIKGPAARKRHCYQTVLNNNCEELKTYGVDTRKNKDFKNHYDLYLKRYKTPEAGTPAGSAKAEKDDGFAGTFVGQEKRESGRYNITLRSAQDNTVRSFLSKEPVSEKEVKKLVAGKEAVIVSYRTAQKEGKEEYVVKSILYTGEEKKQ